MRGHPDRRNITPRPVTAVTSAHVYSFAVSPIMNVVACQAPIGALEPAPLTSLPLGLDDVEMRLEAFWSVDDSYFVRAAGAEGGESWFQIEAEPIMEGGDDATRRAMNALLSNVTPIGGGHIPFPVGTSGRTVFRVWRAGGADRTGRTRILGVRAARSRRRPA